MKKFFHIILILNFVMILVSCTELINPITISFDSKGGNSVESIRFNGGSQLNIPENPILEGFVFDGWFFDDDTFEIPLSITSLLERVEQGGSITVYAKWIIQEDSELTTQLKHIYNLALESDLFTGTYEEWLETVRGPQGLPGENGKSAILRLNDGYIEWKLEGDDIWIRLIDLNSIRGEDGINGLNITLQVADGYIQWQYVGDETWTNLIEISTLTGNTGENGKSAYDLYKENNPDYIGDEQQWLDDLVNNRLGTKQTFKVTFDSNGGTSVEEQVIEPNNKATKPESPIKEGYTFDGWYINGDEKWVFGGFSVTEDITLTAHWIANEYTITLNPGLGLVTPDEIVVTYDSNFVLPTPISEDNYFMGWYYDYQLIESGLWSMTKNVELTAYWIQKEYQVLYNFGYGDLTNIDTALYGEEYAPISIDRIGYTFSGWYTDSDQLYEGDIWLRQDNLNLMAKWTPNTYTITFDLNGGEMTEPTTFTATYDIVDFLPIPTYTGVPFYGWYLDDAKFSNEQGEMLVPYNQTTDITLVAIFYIEISTVEDLNNIRNNLDATYYLMNDIDLLGVEWTPIGDVNNPFKGVINGQGYTISGLTITTAHDYVGFFGYSSGSIYNLKLSNVNINISGDFAQIISLGALIGYNNGFFDEIQIQLGTIYLSSKPDGVGYLGGVVGYNEKYNLTINNITNSVDITGTLTTYTGGIVGYSSNPLTFMNANNSGHISGSDKVGGLIGEAVYGLTIVDSNNFGDITGVNNIGGLIGYSRYAQGQIDIIKSNNFGNIIGNNNIGGLIGFSSYKTIDISNSSNEGQVSGNSYIGGLIGMYEYASASISHSSNVGPVDGVYVGGLVGKSTGISLIQSYNTGDVTVKGYSAIGIGGGLIGEPMWGETNISMSYNSGSIMGHGTLGGLIGQSHSSNVNIQNSFNKGNLTVTTLVTAVGGLVGRIYSTSATLIISKSFNSGNILVQQFTNCYSCEYFIGGILGNSSHAYIYNSVNFGNITTVSNSYGIGYTNYGLIVGDDRIPYKEYVANYYTNTLFVDGIETEGIQIGSKIFDKSTLDSTFFVSTLLWDQLVWDFSNIDITNGIYPLLINESITT